MYRNITHVVFATLIAAGMYAQTGSTFQAIAAANSDAADRIAHAAIASAPASAQIAAASADGIAIATIQPQIAAIAAAISAANICTIA